MNLEFLRWRTSDELPRSSGLYEVYDEKDQSQWITYFNAGDGKNKDSWGDERKIGWSEEFNFPDSEFKFTHWKPVTPPPGRLNAMSFTAQR